MSLLWSHKVVYLKQLCPPNQIWCIHQLQLQDDIQQSAFCTLAKCLGCNMIHVVKKIGDVIRERYISDIADCDNLYNYLAHITIWFAGARLARTILVAQLAKLQELINRKYTISLRNMSHDISFQISRKCGKTIYYWIFWIGCTCHCRSRKLWKWECQWPLQLCSKSDNLTFDAPHHPLSVMCAQSNWPMMWPIYLPP